ncbi:MAG: hypothetical protein K8J08_19125, partial [Thermoanaerobaculia bacterium]|nr:hypothetical protein [Thermoanaerobaculia bacterium]
MDPFSWTLIAGGSALALWWGRGCSSWPRMGLAGLLAAAVVAVPFAADAVVRGVGGVGQGSWLLGVLGIFSLMSSYSVFRRAGSTHRFGTRPASAEVLEEIERARETIGGPWVEGIAGPPIGLSLLAGAGGLANPFVLVTNGVVHC